MTSEIKHGEEDLLGILGDSTLQTTGPSHADTGCGHAGGGGHSSATDGFHTCTAMPLFLAENLGLGATK